MPGCVGEFGSRDEGVGNFYTNRTNLSLFIGAMRIILRSGNCTEYEGVQIVKQITQALAVVTAVSVSGVHAQTSEPSSAILSSTGTPVRQMEPIPDANSNRAVAVGMGFTYQGSLDDGGVPANGEYDIQFTLTDEIGTVMAGPICMENVMVIEGLFTVELDFGDQFNGDARELEMAVRPGGALGDCSSGGYTTLSPRQKLNATPYALGIRLPYSGSQSITGDVFSILIQVRSPAIQVFVEFSVG